MIFIDSNVPMYVVGAEHPIRTSARIALERAIADGERLVTDAEVLQEILYRYRAISRLDAIQPALDVLRGIVDEVIPVTEELVEQAKNVLFGLPELSARDALHVASMRSRSVADILTFDRGFDDVPGIRRLPAGS